MKRVFSSLIISFFFAILCTPSVFAQRVQTGQGSTASSPAAQVQDKMTKQSTNKGDRVEKEITRRLASLEKLVAKLTNAERVSAALKTTLVTQLQAEIDTLTALQAKIDAGVTLAETDMQSIRNKYNAYALYIQKTQILVAADKILVTTDLMSSQAAQLQTKITTAQTSGNDVAELQQLLADMESNMATAQTQAQNAIDTVTPLTPGTYPDNKTQLQNARQMVRTGFQSLLAARSDVNQIITALLRLGTRNVSVTPKITCIPRPACLDATPACDIAEPSTGWCPTQPAATSTAQ